VDPPDEIRAAWRRLVHVVRRDGHVPEGWHLRQRGRNVGDLVIELRPGEHPAQRYQSTNGPAVAVPDVLVDPHPVVDGLRNQPDRLPASSRNRSRTLMILQALAQEAPLRGMVIRSGKESTLMTLIASGIPFDLQIFEESTARWTLRLAVAINGPGSGTNVWADYVRRPVEDELTAVLDEIARRGAAVSAEQEERRRREAEQRERQHQQAVARHRVRILRREVMAWRLAADIRGHCEMLIAAGLDPGDRWIRWALRYADDVDPAIEPAGLPDPPTDEDLARERWTERPRSQRADETVYGARPAWHPNRRWWHN
jgi:hypothetical protein